MCLYPKKIVRKYGDDVIIRCGGCIECLRERAEEWAHRIMLEARQHKDNCFITLTYAETDGSLHKRDLQLFIKRLRKHLEPIKIRYFACGEYGSKGKRPHYHLIIFGWKPDDGYFFRMSDGTPLYRSPALEQLWTAGFSSYGGITYHSAKYCAKYLQKLNDPPEEVLAPFICMSTHPGIGYDAISDDLAKTDRVYVDGKGIKLPRYFLKVLDRRGVDLEALKAARARNLARYKPDKKRILAKRWRLKKIFGKIWKTY